MRLEITRAHLTPEQKAAIKALAASQDTSISAQIRKAVDVYLASPTEAELHAVKRMSEIVQQEIQRMDRRLLLAVKKLTSIFIHIGKIKDQAKKDQHEYPEYP